jgi:hypothetical protein
MRLTSCGPKYSQETARNFSAILNQKPKHQRQKTKNHVLLQIPEILSARGCRRQKRKVTTQVEQGVVTPCPCQTRHIWCNHKGLQPLAPVSLERRYNLNSYNVSLWHQKRLSVVDNLFVNLCPVTGAMSGTSG